MIPIEKNGLLLSGSKNFILTLFILLIGVLIMSICILNDKQKYYVFEEVYFNVATDVYDTRLLDEQDKIVLPEILDYYGYKYEIVNNEIYVEKDLFYDKEMMQKITGELHFKRGQQYWGFED